MLDIIDKNCKTALSTQVSEKLIHEIRSGKLKPGKRMPGERRLAERFGISRGTVIEALDLLESQNYIERVPAKGTFVSEDVNHELSVVKIAFPFPEVSIMPSTLGSMENWTITSETYRGMIAEAREQNAEISFMHFEEASTDLQLSRQLRRLENVDGAIFIGHQLLKLRQGLVKGGKFCVLYASPSEMEPDKIVVMNDLEYGFAKLGALAKKKNYKKLRVITEKNDITRETVKKVTLEKLRIIFQAFEQAGIQTNPDWHYSFDRKDPEGFSRLLSDNDFDLKNGSDVLYYVNTDTVPQFYRYCLENGIKPGKDIGIFGCASGATFSNLTPPFTYSKTDNFEVGRRACALCIEAIRSGEHSNHIEMVKTILVKGESV